MTAPSPNGVAVSSASPSSLSPAAAWKDTLDELKLQMTKATYNQWFKDMRLKSSKNNHFVVSVVNEYAVEWVKERLQDTILRTLTLLLDGPATIEFVVHDAAATPEPAATSSSTEPAYTPPPPPTQQEAQPGQAHIVIHETDPTKGFVAVPHYAIRFWQPLIGERAFALWQTLRSYGFYVRQTGSEWPTIEALVDTLGSGTRHALLGRNGYTLNGTQEIPARDGAIKMLTEMRIAHYWTVGSGRNVTYFFKVLDSLPLLSPLQVELLSPRKQFEHDQYLDYYRAFNAAMWRKITDNSLIPEGWWN